MKAREETRDEHRVENASGELRSDSREERSTVAQAVAGDGLCIHDLHRTAEPRAIGEPRAGFAGRREALECPMNAWKMMRLLEVLDAELPVRVHVVGHATPPTKR